MLLSLHEYRKQGGLKYEEKEVRSSSFRDDGIFCSADRLQQ
ncbi:hypothetical protein C2W64_03611 [Brevibacillus laterosporus]|nr:hypothetical protein C2W64_03611 [Brevibacillus laterosporus]